MRTKGWLIALSAAGSLVISPVFAAQHEGEMGAQSQQTGGEQAASQQQADPEIVRSVQQSLSEQGYDAGPVDGIMGPQTKEALKEFQQAQGLDASGELNEQSLAEMGLEREAAEFAAGEVREGGESGAQPGSEAGGAPDESGMGGQGGAGGMGDSESGAGGMGGAEGGGTEGQPRY